MNQGSKPNYKELLIYPDALKGKYIYSDMARRLMSKACLGKGINNLIFNRQENGHTIHRQNGKDIDGKGFGALPSIIFDGGMGFVRIYGVGQSGIDVLTAESMKLVQALTEELGNNVFRIDFKEGNCTIKERFNNLIPYRIKNLYLTKTQSVISRHVVNGKLPTLKTLEPMIKTTIYRGLVSQAMMIDEEMDQSFLESFLPLENTFECQIFSGEPKFMEIKKDLKTCALGIHNLVFATNFKIEGPWYVGHLRSRGHGAIRKNLNYGDK